jgi:hypothetical protein
MVLIDLVFEVGDLALQEFLVLEGALMLDVIEKSRGSKTEPKDYCKNGWQSYKTVARHRKTPAITLVLVYQMS